MHELPIVQNIIGVVCEKLKEVESKSRVASVRLKVGKMSTAVPDCLEFYFEMMKKGTPLERAALQIEQVPVAAICRQCGEEFEVSEPAFLCPSCESCDIEIVRGRELLVESIELED